jgi:LacI family transcriptional regulator
MLKKKNISIKDVAEKAGVSISTVSRALNNTGYVKKELREKINGIVEELDYKPNIIAKGLRTKRTNTIAVIIPDLKNPYYSEIVEAIERYAQDKGYDILMTCTFYDENSERHQIENLKKKLVDGFIIIHGYYNYNFLQNFKNDEGVFLVTVDRIIDSIPFVCIDHVEAVKKQVDYLFRNGHKEIAYITVDQKIKDPSVDAKIRGYLEGLKKNKIPYKDKYLYTIGASELNQVDKAYRFILKNPEIIKDKTAIINGSDYLAIGTIKALKELGISVPDQISVMGFDNITMAKYVEPSLTTLENPKKEKGLQSIKLLLDLIKSNKSEKSIELNTELVIRESTRKI